MRTCFTLEPRPPFRLDLTVWALRRRPANLVDRWDGTSYRRVMSLAGAVAEVAVRQIGSPDAPTLDVSVMTAAPFDPEVLEAAVTAALRRLLGFGVELDDFYGRVADDPHLGPLADRFRGLKPPRFPTMFECVANAIACQQLTLTVGIMLLNRLAESHGPPTSGLLGATHHAFPEPADLTLGAVDRLRNLGFSTRKAAAMFELARRIAGGELDLESLQQADDAAASAALQHLRGVGRWSAEYALLRGLGRLEVFPGDDVGARNNLARRIGLAAPLGYDDVRQAVAPWAPYAGLAYFHLLVERIDDAGWLDGGEAPDDGAEATFVRRA
jgi:DNA-3-methyladenine glycosylase II